MQILDRLYGSFEIDEAVLLDLMRDPALQRLHGVLQHGISGLLGVTRATSRFEHSIGVMLLVRRLGGTLEEQIAAVLHDVSHTAFSHVIDYVFEGHDSQEFHEEMKEAYLGGTDIPAVLSGYGYDWRDFLSEEKFALLEQPAPALCADRLDYFLRDSIDLGLASQEEVQFALSHLVVYGGRIVVDRVKTALWMAQNFLAADKASWANFREVGLYELAAQAIRNALKLGILSEADLWTTDQAAWDKLARSEDPKLQDQLRLVSVLTQFVWDKENPTFWVSTKLRTIDPPVLLHGRVRPLSDLDPKFARQRAEYLNQNSGKWPIRVVPPAA